jgi:hypothetical protein
MVRTNNEKLQSNDSQNGVRRTYVDLKNQPKPAQKLKTMSGCMSGAWQNLKLKEA